LLNGIRRILSFPGNIHFYRNFMENYISIHEIFKNGNNDTDLKLIYCFHMSKQTQYWLIIDRGTRKCMWPIFKEKVVIQVTRLTPPLFIEVPVSSHESEQSCICVLDFVFPATFYWSACIKPWKWAVMYLCVRFLSFSTIVLVY
jgi:hypothetical protein